jgi:hypothetical protein
MGRPRKSPAASARDRLAAKATDVTAQTAAAEDRETITAEDGAKAEAIDQLCASLHAEKSVATRKAAARGFVLEWAIGLVLRRWVRAGRRLENPRFASPAGSNFILQCKDVVSKPFRLKAGLTIRKYLEDAGVHPDLIGRLFAEKEFDEREVLTVNVPKLEEEAPALADRLMKLIVAAADGGVTTKDGEKIRFSDGDLGTIVQKMNQVSPKAGFLDRSIGHAQSTAADPEDAAKRLEKLLAAIAPQWAIGQPFCADPERGMARLLKAAPEASTSTAVAPVDGGK